MKGKPKQVPFVCGMKLLAFISFILGLGLLSVCFWTIVSLCEGKLTRDLAHQTRPETTNSSELPRPQEFTAITVLNRESTLNSVNDTEITKVIENIKQTWGVLSPFLTGCCAMSILFGCIQIVSCLFILFTASSQGIVKRTRAWEIVHVIILLGFTTCLIVPVSIDYSEKDGGIWNHLKTHRLQTVRKIDLEDVSNLILFYFTLLVEIVGILFLVSGSHFCVARLKSKVVPGKIVRRADRR